MNKKVGIWAETVFAINSSIPIVNKYTKKGYQINYYTDTKFVDHCGRIFNSDKITIIPFSKFSSKQNVIGGWITKNIYKPFFIPSCFSPEYTRQQKRELTERQILLNRIFTFLHQPGNKINSSYTKIISIFYQLKIFKTIFDDDLNFILAFTPVYYPFHLTPILKKTVLIVESWDHPSKRPFLVNAPKCLVWNKDLKEEVIKYQNIKFVSFIKPTKFNYIDKRDCLNEVEIMNNLTENLKKDIDFIKKNKTVIYPVCMPLNRIKDGGEIKFIKYLSEVLSNLNIQLYIRPYPLAPLSDIEFLSKIENCKIGYYSNDSSAMHLLSEQDLDHKYLIFKYAYLVVNIGTTFVFDASYANTNILQIQIMTDKFGKMLREISNYGHISAYLNASIHSLKLSVDNEQYLIDRIVSPDMTHSLYLKKWLLNWT